MAQAIEVGLCGKGNPGYRQVNLAGVILAAGSSTRMGRPKALLEFKGETFLDRLIGHFASVGSEVIVVGRPDLQFPAVGNAKLIVNPDPNRGMLSSLQCGLSAVSSEVDAVIFAPVDYAPVNRQTVQEIARSFNGVLTLPVFEGRRGHPCIVSRQLIQELLALSVDGSAKSVIHAHLSEARLVPVNDSRTVEDVDDPEAYQQLLASVAHDQN